MTKGKIQGCFWGLVLGDALGMPVEFKSIEKIREMYGKDGILDPGENAHWTDDTEMNIAVTKAILRLGKVDNMKNLNEQIIGEMVAEELINWLSNPGIAPGITSTNAVYYLRLNGANEWKKSGTNDSKGCGTVMRAPPLRIWFADALSSELDFIEGEFHELLLKISMIKSEITHGHKAATAAALAERETWLV